MKARYNIEVEIWNRKEGKYEPHKALVELDVNHPSLAKRLGLAALLNKSKTSNYMRGAVTCRVVEEG